MTENLHDAIRLRRSRYALTAVSPLSDAELADLVRFAAEYVPSAFDSRSTRLVLLLHGDHARLWEIVRETLRPLVAPDAFAKTSQKIDTSFAAGYGTLLYFEDDTVVADLQRRFPTYADRFPVWAEHTSAMHQFALWTLLEAAGLGASLQHYNPLIDDAVRREWDLPAAWRLIAQMPFGTPADTPADRAPQTTDARIRIFG